MNDLLTINDLRVEYKQGRSRVHAVDGVSLVVKERETLALVGESGSGKSTIGRAIVGLAPVTSGSIVFDDTDISHISVRARRKLSADIQMIFQDPYGSLNPARTIGQTMVEPLLVHSRDSSAERRAIVQRTLEKVGLPADAADRYPAQFSGGQRQRIAIARALVVEPRLLICDEPVSALDLSIQAQVLNLLADLREEFGIAYLFVAHDLEVVRHLADRTVVLYRGQVMESGPSELLHNDPQHPYTQALVAAAPLMDPGAQRKRREAMSAAAPSSTLAPATGSEGCPFVLRCPIALGECHTTRPTLTDLGRGRSAACFQLASSHESKNDRLISPANP